METQLAYCPSRKCHVRMVWHRVAPEDRSVARPSPLDLVCLDADRACSDPVCALFSVATVRMKDRLRRYRDPRPGDYAE